MKKSAVVRFIGNQEEYKLGCENSPYRYCRDCNQCSGTNLYNFIYGNYYNAYFLEYWEGERTSLHIKGEDGTIEDFIPIGDFEVISDEDNVLNTQEALVRCITHRFDQEFLDLNYGKEYKAIGFDKNGLLLVMDESFVCYFYPREDFSIVSDPDNILDPDSNEHIYDWSATRIDSIKVGKDDV